MTLLRDLDQAAIAARRLKRAFDGAAVAKHRKGQRSDAVIKRRAEEDTGGPVPKRSRADKLRATAYHEAGHAVMAFRLGRGAHRVSIRENDDSLGHVLFMALPAFNPEFDESLRSLWRIEQTIRIALAGPLAEAKYTGKYDRVGASSDHKSVSGMAFRRCASGEAASAYVEWLSLETKAELGLKMVWDGVEELAEELLKREEISWRKARKVIQYGMDRELRKAYGGEIPPLILKK